MADNKKRFAPVEIAESLRHHIDQESCINCPLYAESNCTETMHDTAADMLEELAAEVARLREELRWIPTSERLPSPDDGPYSTYEDVSAVEVLAVIEGAEWATTLYFDGYDFFDIQGDETIPYRVTHWKPMPKGPEVGHD